MAKNGTNVLVLLIMCMFLMANFLSAEIRSSEISNVAQANSNETSNIVERGSEIVDEALVPVYDMVKFFLEDIIQQNDLRHMQEKGVDFSDPDDILDSLENDYEEWIWYAIGYVVLVAIGIVLIVVMSCAGCCTCMCRTCCGKCGGRVQPIPNPNPGETHPQRQKRVCCGVFFFLIMTTVFLGSLTMYFTAGRIHTELSTNDGLFHSLSDGMIILDDYVKKTLDDLEEGTLGTYNDTVNDVFVELDDIVTEAYTSLDSQAKISNNMVPLLEFTSLMPFMSSALKNADGNATYLQGELEVLETNLDNVQLDIETTIAGHCSSDPDCLAMITRVNSVNVTANYTSIDGTFQPLIEALDEAVARNLGVTLEDGYNEFKAIVNEVNASVNTEIENARKASKDVAEDISQELSNVESELDSIDFSGTAQDFEELTDDLKDPADYAWYGMAGIAGLVLLIVLFGYLGLLFGCCCPQAKPGKRNSCCTKKIGATCLLAGVGFTFIFFWILMILLIALMLSGGLLHTELCRHLVHLDQSPVMTIIDDLMNDTLYDEVGFNINISEIYGSCKSNEAFYTALSVEETFGFDLNTILDTSAIEAEIVAIRSQRIVVGPINLLTPGAETLLLLLAQRVDDTKGNIEDAITEMRKPVTSENLGELANDLEDFNQGRGIPGLEAHIAALKGLANDTDDVTDQTQVTVNELNEVDATLSKTNLTAITIGLREGNTTVNNDGSDIIGASVNETTYDVEEIISGGVSAINESVRNEIGSCSPVYNAYAVMVDAGCVELLYPVNGYWFALAWSLFFLIIGVIMSFKLATLYRRTYRDQKAVYPEVGYDKIRVSVISSGK